MTATLDRPTVPRVAVRRDVRERSPLGPGFAAASWALAAGLVVLGLPVLLTWATDSRSGSGAAAATRAVGQLWLVAHGASLTVPGGVVGLTPLGLTLLPLALLHRAGRHGARSLVVHRLGPAVRLTAAIAFPYAAVAAVLAAVSRTHDVRPAPVQAMLGALAVALLGTGSGVVREAGLRGTLVQALPAGVRRLLTGTLVASSALLGAGSLLAGLALLAHAGRASSLAGASDPGLVGGLVLLLAGLLCVPNAAVWGASWLAGPGFAVGVGTSVAPFATHVGAVPAVPLLAALPAGGTPTWLGVLALALPASAGALAGVGLARRGGRVSEALLLGPCAGLLWAALGWLSGGPLGGARLTDLGPSPWRVGLAVCVEVALPAAGAVAVVRRGAADKVAS